MEDHLRGSLLSRGAMQSAVSTTHSLISECREAKASGWIHSMMFQLRSLTENVMKLN